MANLASFGLIQLLLFTVLGCVVSVSASASTSLNASNLKKSKNLNLNIPQDKITESVVHSDNFKVAEQENTSSGNTGSGISTYFTPDLGGEYAEFPEERLHDNRKTLRSDYLPSPSKGGGW